LDLKPRDIADYMVEAQQNTVATIVTLGVSLPSPLKRNLISRFEKEKVSNRNIEQLHVSLYGNSNSGWREWRKPSLSHVDFSS
jgi:hypothetical protein